MLIKLTGRDGIYLASLLVVASLLVTPAYADPESDRQALRHYFHKRFPDLPIEAYPDGTYALDDNARQQWEAIEEFPPYEFAIDEGKALFTTPFVNGKTYAACFPNGGIGIKQNYPFFDPNSRRVVTLELAINECRERNGEQPLPYGRGELAHISAYLAYTSRGKPINVIVPDDPGARRAYEAGKKFYYSRRGQLNMACSSCHMVNAGLQLRAQTLSPVLGQTTHFPVFRSEWESLGTLHRRYTVCNSQIRAKPFALQSETYRNLEYFHTYMSNGLPLNGPGARR